MKIFLFIFFLDEVPEFLLAANPWVCDCRLEWLKSVNHMSADGIFPRILDVDDVTCSRNGANSTTTSDVVQLLSMRSEEFLCQYDAHCIPQCFCCDFFACDCRMQCPEGNKILIFRKLFFVVFLLLPIVCQSAYGFFHPFNY